MSDLISRKDRIMALLSPPSQDVWLVQGDARWIKDRIAELEAELDELYGDIIEYRQTMRVLRSKPLNKHVQLRERIAELEAIEHAARRLVEDGYCNDNNTQQALEAALENNDEWP